jgi:hypothetical protein
MFQTHCLYAIQIVQSYYWYYKYSNNVSISAGGVKPPVLPCLHNMYQGKFTPDSDVLMIDMQEDLQPFYSDNTQTLGELLYEFLRYYVEFE